MVREARYKREKDVLDRESRRTSKVDNLNRES